MPIDWDEVYGRKKPEGGKPSWDEIYGRSTSPQKKSFGEAALLGALDWGTLGFFDEAVGGIGGLLNWDGKDSKYWTEYWRLQQQKAQEDEYGAYALGGIGGSILTGGLMNAGARAALGVGKAALGAGSVAQAAGKSTLAQRAMATAPAAAAGGAVSGIGATNDRGDWRENAAWGGLLGGVSAPLLYAGAAGIKNAAASQLDKMFGVRSGPKGKAATWIEEEMALQGQTPDQLKAKIKGYVREVDPNTGKVINEGNRHAWVGDAMENADGDNYGFELTKAASGKQGPALVSAKGRAKTRNMELGNDTVDTIWEKTPDVGKRQVFSEIMQTVGDEDEALSAVYNKIHGTKLPINPEMSKIIQYPNSLSGPMRRVSEAMLGARPGVRQPRVTKTQMLRLSQDPRFWQRTLTATREEVDDAFRRGDPNARTLKSGYEYLRSTMGKIIGPEWVETQEKWATNKLREEAAKFGHRAIMETDGVKLADNLSQINQWDEAIAAAGKSKLPRNATPDQVAAHESIIRNAARARTSRQAARKGMAARLEEAVRKQQTRSGVRNMMRNIGDNAQHEEVVMRLLGGRRVTTGPNKGQWDARMKLSTLMDTLDENYKMFDNIETSGILKGPKTAEVLGGSSAIDAATDAADVTKDILSGNILGGVLKALNRDQSKKFGRESAEVHNEIVRLTTQPVEDAQREILQHGGVNGWLNSRGTMERMQKLAERRAKKPLTNAKRMAAAVGGDGVYSGYGAGELRDLMFGSEEY